MSIVNQAYFLHLVYPRLTRGGIDLKIKLNDKKVSNVKNFTFFFVLKKGEKYETYLLHFL